MTLADQISKNRGQPATVRIGTVTGVNPLMVDVQGAEFTNVGSLDPHLFVGDVVALLGQSAVSADGSSWLALGRINAGSFVSVNNVNGIQLFPAGVLTNATGVYADITGATFAFTKLRDSSRVLMQMAGSAYVTLANAMGEFGARITAADGTPAAADEAIASLFYNVAVSHQSWSGFRFLSGLPAGDYTIQGRFRLSVVVGALTIDNNDRISLAFTETN